MKTRTHRHDRIIGILFFIVCFCLPGALRAGAEAIDTTTTKEVYMIKGELVNLKTDGLERISVTNPEVADIIKADEQEILMVGQSVGQTALFIWDKQGKRSLTVYVFSQDLESVEERLGALLQAADIGEAKLEIDGREGKVVASGDIPEHKKEQFDQIVEKFGDDVLNLAKEEEIDDLIQIAVQITELSTTLSKNMGIDWTTGSADAITLTYPETLPAATGSSNDYFKLGDFNRTSALLATVDLLIAEGKARILSQPKLVVKNAEEASFLVGGEIPVRTTTSTQSGGTQENVSFKSYGISMTITPEIKKGKIDITLNVTISDVDSSNAVGDDVAFTSRSAQTKLYLDDGQTIILAGLIKQNRSKIVNKVPILGDIPVVGLLFRKESNPTADTDQELVISLTPTVLTKNRGKIPSVAQKMETEEMPVEEMPVREEKESSAAKVNADLDAPAPAATEETGVTTGAPLSAVEDAVVPAAEAPTPANDEPLPAAPVVPAVSSSEAEQPASQGGIDEYVQSVQQKIAQAIVYPQEAERSGWEGTVKLSLLILSDGTLATAVIRESSGHEIFDNYTLSIAKDLAPYSSFPSGVGFRELNVTIPVVYSLKKN